MKRSYLQPLMKKILKKANEVDISILATEMAIWKQILIDVNPVCFSDIISHLRTLKKKKKYH